MVKERTYLRQLWKKDKNLGPSKAKKVINNQRRWFKQKQKIKKSYEKIKSINRRYKLI